MSQNPFREGEIPNPYAPPSMDSASLPTGMLAVPAGFLAVLSTLQGLILTLSLPSQIARLREIDLSTPGGQGELTGGITVLVGWFLAELSILLGSINMMRRRSYGSAMAAAIVSVVPICSPCLVLGIPFGIWAIMVLRKPHVKATFQ